MSDKLTSDDLKALRYARSVSFHFNAAEKRSYIMARIDHDPGDGFGPREIVREIPVLSMVTTYERPAHAPKHDPTKAYWSVTSPHVDARWTTIVNELRAGDELCAHWFMGNNSDALRDAGLTAVEFDVEVIRDMRSGKRKSMSFLVGYAVERVVSPVPSVSYV